MESPGLRTLLSFLGQVRRNAPTTFTTLCEERRRGYGMVNRYIRFCLSRGLIRIVSERRTRGRYPSKTYDLSERGAQLLKIFTEGVE